MSNHQYAFLRKVRVPPKDQWQQALNETGFDLAIDSELVVFQHIGFLPCKLLGKESGVEVSYLAAKELFDNPADANEIAGDRDFCISFRWSGRFDEAACAMILSYSLARSFDAVVSYECEEPYATLEDLRADTETIIQQASKKS